MAYLRTSPRVTQRDPGEIAPLSKVNAKTKGAQPQRTQSLGYIFRSMKRGDSVFLPGYTSNSRDHSMIKCSPGAYTRDSNWVWTVRSTVEKGIKGLRVYRSA